MASMARTRRARYLDQRPLPQPRSRQTEVLSAISGPTMSKYSAPTRSISSSEKAGKRSHSSPNDSRLAGSTLAWPCAMKESTVTTPSLTEWVGVRE
jgi:hypothetical protein